MEVYKILQNKQKFAEHGHFIVICFMALCITQPNLKPLFEILQELQR